MPPPPPPVAMPADDSEAKAAARRDTEQAAGRRQGLKGTVKTSGLGDTSTANVSRKYLLGQ